MRVVVVIPALDCARTIASVVSGASARVDSVVVVDDGSRDATAELAARAGAKVIRHPDCRGKAAALRAGMSWAIEAGATHVLTMDGDGQHFAEEIPLLLDTCASDPGAFVVGARILEGVDVAPIKLFGNRFANRWVEIASGAKLADTQSGFRIYPVEALLRLECRAERFAFETEVLIRAAHAGIPIRSVPVRVYYPPPEERTSHYRPFLDTVRIIRTVVPLWLRRALRRK